MAKVENKIEDTKVEMPVVDVKKKSKELTRFVLDTDTYIACVVDGRNVAFNKGRHFIYELTEEQIAQCVGANISFKRAIKRFSN